VSNNLGAGLYLPMLGGTLQGPLLLAADPAANAPLGAVTKQYVDAAPHSVGRNLLHNGLFNVQQRGTGPWTTSGVYTADRWRVNINGTDTDSWSLVALSDTARSQIGDEAAIWCLSNTFTGSAAAGCSSYVGERIEKIRRLSGKTATVSFYAAAASGSPQLAINAFERFGTGGSPSPDAWVFATGFPVTLSTTWARYSVTFTIPSVSGKTFGTNGDDFFELDFIYTSTPGNPIAGNIPAQSGTIQLWGVQLEVGSVATPLEKPEYRIDLANCQRFYQVLWALLSVYQSIGATNYQFAVPFAVPMRASPTLTTLVNNNTNMSGFSLAVANGYVYTNGAAAAAGTATVNINFTASADL
jgi:hypothetical protein